jgi:hypothetical protein
VSKTDNKLAALNALLAKTGKAAGVKPVESADEASTDAGKCSTCAKSCAFCADSEDEAETTE